MDAIAPPSGLMLPAQAHPPQSILLMTRSQYHCGIHRVGSFSTVDNNVLAAIMFYCIGAQVGGANVIAACNDGAWGRKPNACKLLAESKSLSYTIC